VRGGRSPRLVIVGLDGADPALLSRFIEDGTTPNLGRLAARGFLVPLRSTTPPVTFPAWTSFLTGTEPSTHGIPDFTIRGGYRVRFAGAADCAVPTFFEHLEGLGLTCGVAWFPAPYPPRPLRRYHISAWHSPVTAGGDPSFVHPRSLHDELRARFGADHLEFDTVDEFLEGQRWYLETAAALPRALARRARVAAWLLEHRPVDVAAFYFGETDTVAHHFWAFHDPTSPRRPARFPAALGSAVADVYRAADDAVGLLLERIDDGCPVILLSDHGSGGSSDVAVHLNRVLERAGLLRFASRPALSPLTTFLRGGMVGAVPRGLRRPLFRAAGGLAPAVLESGIRFGAIDMARTAAFSEELNYAPSVWLNLEGREREGTVRPGDEGAVTSRVREALMDLRLPGGRRLVSRVLTRAEIHGGPMADRFPDLTVVLEPVDGHTPACLPSRGVSGPPVTRLAPKDRLGRKGRSLPGCHTPAGVLIVSGRGAGTVSVGEDLGLGGIAGLACDLLGVPSPPRGDRDRPDPIPDDRVPTSGGRYYTADQERMVAERLRRLGYLEE